MAMEVGMNDVTTTRPVFRVNGGTTDTYADLMTALRVVGVGRSHPHADPAWWGNATDPSHPGRYVAADGSGGLPVPLRPQWDAPEDAEATNNPSWVPLERGYSEICGFCKIAFINGPGDYDAMWVPPGVEPRLPVIEGGRRYGRSEAERTLRELCVSSRELRARLPFVGATGVACDRCGGEGGYDRREGPWWAPYDETVECPDCNGTGRIMPERVPQERDAGVCPVCYGTNDDGSQAGDPCPTEFPSCSHCHGGRIDGHRGDGEDYDGGDIECAVCRSKPGTPLLCDACADRQLANPSAWTEEGHVGAATRRTLTKRELARRHASQWSAGVPDSDALVPMGRLYLDVRALRLPTRDGSLIWAKYGEPVPHDLPRVYLAEGD